MSDKFFFQGRQNSRQDHAGGVFKTKAGSNLGSEKYPLDLVVTSEARQQEVQALVDEAQLYAQISVDSSKDAEESIAELTALLNKGATVKLDKTPARNDPCSCGSGKKYKKCCG
ncbi:zinc chelation protein SecC [Halieaceae bacterium IMCC14734]|uniref:Zinc chelation protein SecC n=1 Tax=Candidatus Litorirhabdus singularis TaxID=2518993 RepID=A0ABT3TGR7_9GAMM|nr:PBPRA1643 family SWIM/SEC-C metal-binding motif protein [Candidatus Litorirhabdus singularis]MCX2980609.1 zinc chelation protein SecC [Candidatus Litorirhabdus singularis]